MNEPSSSNGPPRDEAPSATDVDPRFDDAAVGTEPPRPDAAAPEKTPQQQFTEMTAAFGEWVRSKPMQALALAAGLGFLLGRGGR